MITINASPSGSPSVHDAMWHIVSSDNSGAVDFKYVFDIYVNGVQKIRVKKFPEPANGKGYFDAGPTVRNSMTYEWFEPINTSALVAEPNMSGEIGITYAVRIGEDVSGVTTLNMASGEVSGYNWVPPLFGRRVTDLTSMLNRLVTNRATIDQAIKAETAIDENLFIGFYTQDLNSTLYMRCRSFDFSNNLVQDVSGTIIAAPLLSGFAQLNIGTAALEASLGTGIDESIKYYEISMRIGVLVSSYVMRVYLKCNPKYNCTLVHFLNRWGLWETQRFDLVSKLQMKIERKGFGQRDYKMNDTSVDYYSANNKYYEGKIDYNQAANWTYKLTADAMTDGEWVWMADLMQSPQILMEIDGYHYPVTIKETNYEYKKFVNDRLKPLEIEFEMNTTRYTQLR